MARKASGVRRKAGRTDSGSCMASPHASRLTSHGAGGYTLVAVVIGMAVMAILIAAVAPSVATIMKRDREQELIFRGKQYARAIVLFQKRYGRFPNELKEMYTNQPRTIRKLWKDPMCNCADWQVIHPNTPDAIGTGGGTGLPGRAVPGVNSGGPQPTPTPGVFGPAEGPKEVGPIIGVRSKVHGEALAEWRGQKFYDQWRFIMRDADRDTSGFNEGRPGGVPPGFPGYPTGPTPGRGR